MRKLHGIGWGVLALVAWQSPALAETPTVWVTAERTAVVADGLSSTALDLVVTGEDGLPVPDGTVVPLSSTLGHVLDVAPTVSGVATAVFRAGTYPGVACLHAEGWQVSGDWELSQDPGDPVSTTLHLHGSFSEGSGTMQGHAIEADRQGIDVLWWTDHDYFYYPEHQMEMTGYNFESGSLSQSVPIWPAGTNMTVQWKNSSNTFNTYTSTVRKSAKRVGVYGWRLQGTSEGGNTWKNITYDINATPIPLNIRPLMGQVDFGFAVRPTYAASANAELWVTLTLSTGPDGQANTIYFYHSSKSYQANANEHNYYQRISGTAGSWTTVNADISAIARSHFPSIGEDATVKFCRVQVRAKGTSTASYDFDEFVFTQDEVGEGLRDAQRAYLDALPYTPRHLAGAELGLGQTVHINAFGSSVPFLSYAQDVSRTTQEVVDHVHNYGGLAAYNHMFGVRLTELDALSRAEEVVTTIEDLVGNEVYGCDLIEVGYRVREGLLTDFLEVWDALSMAGIYITGIGANDVHDQTDWDDWTNNFVTWVASGSSDEEDLIWNLRRGAAWFGDPTLFPDGDAHVSVTTASKATMGQVVVGAVGAEDVTFRAGSLMTGWEVRLVENGVVTQRWVLEADGDYETTVSIDPTLLNVVRFEVITEAGEPVLYTNPIYFVDAVLEGEVPVERLPDP